MTMSEESINFLKQKLADLSGRPKILLVEDDANDAALTINTLRKFICEVRLCPSGEEAVEVLREFRFDLVLLDLKLPAMSGNQVIEEVRGFGMVEPPKFVVLTGYANSPWATESMRSGAVVVHPKPLTAEFLSRFLSPAATKPPSTK